MTVPLVVIGAVFIFRDDDDEPSNEPPRQELLPLLGLPGDIRAQGAVVVKIDNVDAARPQAGLDGADVVVEELVEGGLTRLMAIYHSESPERVGPVRSARTTDLSILPELGKPAFAWSGANPTVASQVRETSVIDVGADSVPDAYSRDSSRAAPHNLYTGIPALRDAAEASDREAARTPPPALFTYHDRPSDAQDLAEAQAATALTTTGQSQPVVSSSIGWDWNQDQGVWLRNQNGSPHETEDGDQLSATNVLVRFTNYNDTGQRDSAGAVVYEAETVGEGDALLLTAGQAIPGQWHKPGPDGATTFTTTDGQPLTLTPGNTWVEILPPGSTRVS